MTYVRPSLVVALLLVGVVAAVEPGDISVRTMPPVVVKTEPRAGDTEVDPSTTEVRATFSKDMMAGSWSWVQISNETFPKIAGEIHYLKDKRTCVMPVKLQPGRTYVIWLNQGERFTNFMDGDGRPAVAYLLVFQTASAGAGSRQP